jgi:hypothetical protein
MIGFSRFDPETVSPYEHYHSSIGITGGIIFILIYNQAIISEGEIIPIQSERLANLNDVILYFRDNGPVIAMGH